MKRLARVLSCVALALASVTALATTPAHAVSANIGRIIAPPGVSGVLYVDNGGYCQAPGSTRNYGYDYDANGRISIPGVGSTNTLSCPGNVFGYLRTEVYPVQYGVPDCGGWNPFTSPAGGAHADQTPGTSIGDITLPSAGTGGIKPTGRVIRASGLTANCNPDPTVRHWQQTGGILIDIFQDDGFRLNGKGAFGTFFANSGNDITLGWIYPGSYSVFIWDKATNTEIRVQTSFDANTPFDIDLDASCFGFDLCSYVHGAPPATGGGFHPLAPARILDTRAGVGIGNGRVRAGDGSLPNEPNPDMRLDEAMNHQTKVTGVGGVPEHGVSAVLLNVTVDQPDANSWLAISPKLPRDKDKIFEDQSWFRKGAPTSNLNFKRLESLPNLVLARVGAGGRIMVENFAGTADVIADIVGWVDTGSGGDGFTGVTPERILDTRSGDGAFGAREVRHVKVTERSGVPADATAVVLNVTQIDATAHGYLTVWPTGLAQPGTSNLNGAPGRTRPNLVVSKVGVGGQIDIFNFAGTSDVAVDVVGYFSPNGGKIYPVSPARIMDSRTGLGTTAGPFGAAERRNLTVVGIDGVPSNATAVILNVTGVASNTGSFLTVFPAGGTLPKTSNVNLDVADAAPNLVMMKVGANGQITIYNDRGQGHVIVDVMGYVA